jgi:hypothetical protein
MIASFAASYFPESKKSMSRRFLLGLDLLAVHLGA